MTNRRDGMSEPELVGSSFGCETPSQHREGTLGQRVIGGLDTQADARAAVVPARVHELGVHAHEGLVGAKRQGRGHLDDVLADAFLGHAVGVIRPGIGRDDLRAVASIGPVLLIETVTESGVLITRSWRGGE